MGIYEKKVIPVQLRKGFSDRHGIKPLNTQMQFKDFDKHTRIAILNALHEIMEVIDQELISYSYCNNIWAVFYLRIGTDVYSQEKDQLEGLDQYDLERLVKSYIRNTILLDSYDSVLTVVEFILNYTSNNFANRQPHFDGTVKSYFDERKYMNDIFEKEYVGYRFIGEYIVSITDDVEINEIEETLDSKVETAKKHIEKALGFLSDREKPDYKNSVKESISAIEATCKFILEDNKVDLSGALKKLKTKGVDLHQALSQSLDKLYAYASDKGGVRHSEKLVESLVSFEEAKFVLVTSCAIVNFLIHEYGKSNEI